MSKLLPITMAAFCCFSGAQSALANTQYGYTRPYAHVRVHHYRRHPASYWARHPRVKAAAIGAGVGAAGGAVTGLVTGRGVVRGAVIGAGAGAGVGLIRTSPMMRRHPIVKDVATGSVVGLGLGLAGGRNHGTAARTTLVGGAAGLATGLLVHGL